MGSIEAESKFGPSSLLLVVGLRELRFGTFLEGAENDQIWFVGKISGTDESLLAIRYTLILSDPGWHCFIY